jgi:hypothetical protein
LPNNVCVQSIQLLELAGQNMLFSLGRFIQQLVLFQHPVNKSPQAHNLRLCTVLFEGRDGTATFIFI